MKKILNTIWVMGVLALAVFCLSACDRQNTARASTPITQIVLNTDDPQFGGNGLTDDSVEHLTNFDPLYKEANKGWLKLYIPARSAMVLKKR